MRRSLARTSLTAASSRRAGLAVVAACFSVAAIALPRVDSAAAEPTAAEPAGVAASQATSSTGASAVVSTGGAASVQTTMPSNLAKGHVVSPTSSELYAERSDYVLPTALAVDVTEPSAVPILHKTATPGSIPAGMPISSWYLHTDPSATPPSSKNYFTNYQASVTFSTPILGIILTPSSLGATDTSLGNPDVIYPGPGQNQRGLELTGAFGGDSIEFANAYTLKWSLHTSVYLDDFRIITAANIGTSPTGATFAPGYRLVAADGGIFDFDRSFFGSTGGEKLNKPIVGGADAVDTLGYYLVASDGGIFAFGDAQFYGSTGSLVLNKPVVGMAVTPSGGGYYLFASDGGVFSFGSAPFEGSLGALKLNAPIVGGVIDPNQGGYWEVATDGGVFAFNAPFLGSAGALPLNRPVVGMAAMPDGQGYWLVASDGGVFAYGDAGFYGSMGGKPLNQPVVSIISTPDGKGYWLVAKDGGIFSFGDAKFLGSTGSLTLNKPIVDGF